MAYRLAWLAGIGGVGLALFRLERLVSEAETGLPWPLALAAAALLGGLITWIALAYRIGGAGIVGANLLVFSLAAVRIGAPQEAALGVLPTWTTFEILRDELSLAIDVIRFGSPPVPPLAGLLVILAAVFWALGALLAWGVTSGRPALALVPPLLFYLQLATIDRIGPGAVWVMAAFLLVTCTFLAVAFDERRARGRIRTAAGTSLLPSTTASLPLVFVAVPTALALIIMSALSAQVDEGGLIGWRGGGLGAGGVAAGVSYNLFADSIQQGLVADSETEIFRAVITGDIDPASVYFRMVTLDRFDGRHWIPGRSPGTPPPEGQPWGNAQHVQAGTKTRVTQDIEVAALSMNVLPAVAQPRALETPVSIIEQGYRIGEDGSIWLQVRTRRGNRYRVTSEVATADIRALASSRGELSPIFAQARADGVTDLVPRTTPGVNLPDDIEAFLEIPDDLHPAIREEAVAMTEGGTTPYEVGLLLEGYFLERGGFTYTTSTEGHGARDMVDWLFDPLSDNYRAGYCEQFATAMGVMARTIGIPSRVVLGFTPGDVIGDEVVVRERHGHAWVELWIEGHGWVDFDPTPRSDGQNARTTMGSRVGFDPAEHLPPPPEEIEGDPTDELPGRTQLRDILDQPFQAVPPLVLPGTSIAVPAWLVALFVLPLVASIIPGIKWLRRRRRWERLRKGDISAAWLEITDRLIDLGKPVHPHQTPMEVARSTHASLSPLAHEYGRATYGPVVAPSRESIATAERSLASAESHLRSEYPWLRKAWSWIRPGSLGRR